MKYSSVEEKEEDDDEEEMRIDVLFGACYSNWSSMFFMTLIKIKMKNYFLVIVILYLILKYAYFLYIS